MVGNFRAVEFRTFLDEMLPADTFRSGGSFGGKAVWVFEKNLWTLTYQLNMGAVTNVTIVDECRHVTVDLSRSGVGCFPAILKAVGAVSA
jgi:hypothetical protein